MTQEVSASIDRFPHRLRSRDVPGGPKAVLDLIGLSSLRLHVIYTSAVATGMTGDRELRNRKQLQRLRQTRGCISPEGRRQGGIGDEQENAVEDKGVARRRTAFAHTAQTHSPVRRQGMSGSRKKSLSIVPALKGLLSAP